MSKAAEGASEGTDGTLVGRERELRQIRACLRARRNVLLEGPVGVGKTPFGPRCFARVKCTPVSSRWR